MKRILVIIAFLVLLLAGCNNNTKKENISSSINSLSVNNVSINSDSENETVSEYNIFCAYQITDGNSDFVKKISQNKIDINYKNEWDTAMTNGEMIDIEKKYIEIWKDEMLYSIDNIELSLNEEEKKSFEDLQKRWEDCLINNHEFEFNILTDEENNILLGSSFQFLWRSDIREAYRDRTFRIKYLNYLLETPKLDDKPLDEWLSLKFKNN